MLSNRHNEIKKVQLLAARFEEDDARRIEEIAKRLELKVADVLRRAARAGLAAFDEAKLPGGSDTKESTT
jgi:hypothetical protein